ncbi:MAG: tail fiber protein [Xanthobacteraceae bacterium]
MSSPYVGQILMVGFNFAPAGWMLCQGQLLPISEYETLFQLIGTTYGGDGQSTFGLPNLSGRVPLHMGTGASGTTYTIGESAGVESVTLTTQQIPNHNHLVQVLEAPGGASKPGGNILATEALSVQQNCFTYGAFGGTQSTLAPATIQPAGGSQPHENMQPYLTVNFAISLFGVFPSQN